MIQRKYLKEYLGSQGVVLKENLFVCDEENGEEKPSSQETIDVL